MQIHGGEGTVTLGDREAYESGRISEKPMTFRVKSWEVSAGESVLNAPKAEFVYRMKNGRVVKVEK